MDRLYVIVRADLPAGLQLAQACHAVLAFATAFDARPENMIVLHAQSKEQLTTIEIHAEVYGMEVAAFTEPDLGGELTAVAVRGEKARRFLADMPLAFATARAA